MSKIGICLGFLIFVLAFIFSIRWARQIQSDSLWAAISPSYVGDAIQEKEHGTPWLGVPFCASFKLLASSTLTIQESPLCESLKAKFPSSGICGIQSSSASTSAGLPSDFIAPLKKFIAEKQCDTLVLDVDSSSDWSTAVASELKKALPDVQLVRTLHPRGDSVVQPSKWKSLCDAYDEVIVLAYDNHMPGKTEIGEMAPVSWVRSLLGDALAVCPKEKLRLGIAAYGYNWKTGALLPENQAGFPQVNDDFIETTKKRAEKVNLAHAMGIHKFFLWALGMEH